MKGVSIALETIVYIILAVTVLTVLLFFFTSQVPPVEDRTKLEQRRTILCGQYAQYDNTCTQFSTFKDNPDISNKITELLDVCKRLNTRSCPGTTDTTKQACIQYCCLTCPTKPPGP